jgi:hypothetical protein
VVNLVSKASNDDGRNRHLFAAGPTASARTHTENGAYSSLTFPRISGHAGLTDGPKEQRSTDFTDCSD